RKDNEIFQKRSILSQLTMSIWYSFCNIFGYGVNFHVNTAAECLLTFGLYMLSLILVATYTANLASYLTISKSKHIISEINSYRNYYPLKSQQNLYDSLLAGIIDASFMDNGVSEYITNNIYCNLTLVEDDFEKGVFGIVTPKEWLYTKDLDVNILLLSESGQLDYLRQKWFQK
ncbi:unnamed protein product, partial [Rotaria sordida]